MVSNSWAILLVTLAIIDAFVPIAYHKSTSYAFSRLIQCNAEKEDLNPVVKASWFAAEALGKVFAPKTESSSDPQDQFDISKPPTSLQETKDRIRLDNDKSYFLSGQVDALIYDDECIFADPFVSFAGRDRFVENLSNLGSFITKYSAKMIDYETTDELVSTKVRDDSVMTLPIHGAHPYDPTDYGETGIESAVEAGTCVALGRRVHNRPGHQPNHVSCGIMGYRTLGGTLLAALNGVNGFLLTISFLLSRESSKCSESQRRP